MKILVKHRDGYRYEVDLDKTVLEHKSHPSLKEKKEQLSKKRAARDPKKAREERLRNFFLLTVEDADCVLDFQENKCAICGQSAKETRRLALDHRHSDGLLRGGLCSRCNRAIATFLEQPALLRAAANYLDDPPATRALGREHFCRPGRIGTKKQRAAIRREKKANFRKMAEAIDLVALVNENINSQK